MRWLSRLGVAASLLVLAGVGLGPHTGRYQVLTVLSGSMSPSIPAGSVILVTPADPASLEEGDVITYSIPVGDRRVVTHRIVEIVRTGANPVVRTKGDSNDAVDPWTAKLDDDAAWQVRRAFSGVGFVLRGLQDDEVRRVATLVPPLLLAIAWLYDIWGRKRCALPA